MTHNQTLSFAPDFDRALNFFRTQAAYEPSPLDELRGPNGMTFLAKDETRRMGLGAFKALGAPYAVARIIDAAWQSKTGETLTPARYHDHDLRAFAAGFTFVCASAGNHGMGVAVGARAMGASARIHLAKTVPASFAERLRGFGADVVRSGSVYDESVAAAIADARDSNAVLLADGTWPGYTEIPKWVMEGYCVIAEELRATFEGTGRWPTHVYLQAGVGGLAAAMAYMIRLNWGLQPKLIVVEPEVAACLMASHRAGHPARADGPDSNMGRLDCKQPSIVAWAALEKAGVSYLTVSEEEGASAAEAITKLGIPTTPSGAAGYAGLLKDHVDNSNEGEVRPLIILSEGPA